MARPPAPNDRVAKWFFWDNDAPYQGDKLPLWLDVVRKSPITVLDDSLSYTEVVTDRLILETKDDRSDKEWSQVLDGIAHGHEQSLSLFGISFHSDCPPRACYDPERHGWCVSDNEEWIDYVTGDFTAVLGCDDYGRLILRADWERAGWADFGYDLFVRKLATPHTVAYWEDVVWWMMSVLSPDCTREVERRIGEKRAIHCHPELLLDVAPRQDYRLLAVPAVRQEFARICHALMDQRTLFTKEHLRVLFGTEPCPPSPDAKDPADVRTINRLIASAHIRPEFRCYYSTRQVTHQLLPTAIRVMGDRERYVSLRETLIDAGVEVPDMPNLIRC